MTRRGPYRIWFYVGYVLGWAIMIVIGATAAGAVLFPLVGKIFGSTLGIGELALSGARHFAEWTAKVWALSIGIVLAFHHAYRHRHRREPGGSDQAPGVADQKSDSTPVP